MLKRINRLTVIVVAALLMGSCGSLLYAQSEGDAELEYKVKAGFIFNFLKFVSWPQEAQSDSWNIGIIASDGIVDLVSETLAGKTIDGRAVNVFKLNPKADDQGCHVVFVCRRSTERASGFTESLRGKEILIVGESEGFAQAHGIIGFVKKGQNLRLEINPSRAKGAGLVISGKLASLADLVEDIR